MYTSPERVVKNGKLVAFAGETMTDEEAKRRGLIGAGASSPTYPVDAAPAHPMNEKWADAAGMDLEDLTALWDESPDAVLDAVLQHASGSQDAEEDAEGEESEPKKRTKAELRAACDEKGIKYPKNATIVQLEALLEE